MKSISFDQAQRKRQKYWKTSFISISPQRSGQLSTPHLSWPKFRSRHVMMPTISIMQDGIRKLLRTCRLKPHKVSAPNKLPSRLPKADEITDLFDFSSRIRVPTKTIVKLCIAYHILIIYLHRSARRKLF